MKEHKTIFSYQIGGSLASKSPSYIERKADQELDRALRQGEFCYVLNSRQMGKSSLRVRAMEKLQAEKTVCIFIDLTGMGTQDLTPEKWYAGIVRSLVSGSQLKFNWRKWWREKRDLFSPLQRLSLFIEEVLLVEITEKIVIFIDEIDRVLSQKFSLDDFFALMHSCYQKRQVNPHYHRLTFTLLGVAAPRDLISDKTQSPFDIGKAIILQGFKLEEALPLTSGLMNKVTYPEQILADILYWTGGQPFLTQKLCQLVVEKGNSEENNIVANIVDKYIVTDWDTQDEPEHLRTIRDRLCYRNSSATIRLLGLYREVLQQGKIRVNNNPEQIELRLSGLVVERHGNLEANNPIYTKVFNLAWVDNQLAQLRPYSKEIANWMTSNNCDPTYLLKGKDLQDALSWSLGKSLGDIDYQFLVASQNLAKQKTEDTLTAVKAASKLLARARKKARHRVYQQRLDISWLALIASGVTALILLLRSTGILQTWEWNALDLFFGWRLTDHQEPQIAVVTIDDQDIADINQWPIPDSVFAKAIKNLKAHQPSAIALDVYRDIPVPDLSNCDDSGNRELLQIFNSTPNLFAVEKVIGDPGISPPKDFKQEQVGFADQITDGDGRVRRALLSLGTDNDKVRLSLGAQLALHYLGERDIHPDPIDEDPIRYGLGKAIFKRFESNDGGYVRTDNGGTQILLNFWGTQANFKQYSLTEVLNGKIAPQDLQNRLIFIGTTAESIKDVFDTPYSNNQGWFRSPEKMPGVFIHANVASQIIDAALGKRPLLRTHNKLSESLWILLWGIIGVIIFWRWQSTLAISGYVCLTTIILIITCYLAFLSGWWLPLVPSILTLIMTVIMAITLRNQQRDRQKFQLTLAFLLAEHRERPIVSRIALEHLKQSENKDNSDLIEQEIKQLPFNKGV
ncbi:CHASE2 domain-containing protein [Pleurocapsa sp. PCC 7319]|uniref:CHASE2 domain-containing protein n=1 Tax=Pleurocapsa sp. PCC 7319 TaxID=118161 RepID=UPI0003498F14|nr:CHASE2 domain-containing protein [Pleurocapsa sp. PCC 7319]